jgi:anti-sigma factor RsiW
MSAISDKHIDLGAYALGLLNDRDTADFEAHLATCAACAAEMATLRPVAELLKGLDPVEEPGDAAVPQPPVDLLRRRAQVSRRRRRWQVAAGAAACVAALGGGLAAGIAAAPGSAVPVVAGQLHTAHDAATGATGTVGLVAKSWGTQVTLDLAGVRGPAECQLIAVAKDGRQEVVTGWYVQAPGDGVPGHPGHLMVPGGTAIPLTSLTQFKVIIVNGPTLLTIPV